MKLFIAYSRADASDFAHHISRYFENESHSVFTDVKSIRVGDVWADSIEKNIAECDIFIVIITKNSLRSSYIETEVLEAQKQNKIIVPCFHEYVDYSAIQWGLKEKQGIEFLDEYKLGRNLYSKLTTLNDDEI